MPLSSTSFEVFVALGARSSAYGLISIGDRVRRRKECSMAGWDDVCDLAERLPGAILGRAHECSPAWYAGPHAFARLRWEEDDRELVEVWS